MGVFYFSLNVISMIKPTLAICPHMDQRFPLICSQLRPYHTYLSFPCLTLALVDGGSRFGRDFCTCLPNCTVPYAKKALILMSVFDVTFRLWRQGIFIAASDKFYET